MRKYLSFVILFFLVWVAFAYVAASVSAAPSMNRISTVIVVSFFVFVLGLVCAFISRRKEQTILGIRVSSWVAEICQGLATEMFGASIVALLFAFIIDRSGA